MNDASDDKNREMGRLKVTCRYLGTHTSGQSVIKRNRLYRILIYVPSTVLDAIRHKEKTQIKFLSDLAGGEKMDL